MDVKTIYKCLILYCKPKHNILIVLIIDSTHIHTFQESKSKKQGVEVSWKGTNQRSYSVYQ